MNAPNAPPSLLRVSLRELLAGLALVGVACAALKYAGDAWWTVLSAAALVGFLAAAVVAVVGRGPGQARAMGFVLCVTIYGLLIWSAKFGNGRNAELDPYEGRLPTTRLLKHVFESQVVRTYIDAFTGKEMPNYNPPPGTVLGNSGTIISQETPDRFEFMAIGHLLWAVLFGYLGSRFAAWVDGRRRARESSEAIK